MRKIRGKKMKWTPDRIKSLRDSFGDNREQFADRLAVSKFSIRNWEQGQTEPSDRVQMLLDHLQRELHDTHVKQPA